MFVRYSDLGFAIAMEDRVHKNSMNITAVEKTFLLLFDMIDGQTSYFKVEAEILYSFDASIGCYITIFGVYFLSHVDYSMLHTLNRKQN